MQIDNFDDKEILNEMRWPEGIDVESSAPNKLTVGEVVRVRPSVGLIAHFVGMTGVVRKVTSEFMGIMVEFACHSEPHAVHINDLHRHVFMSLEKWLDEWLGIDDQVDYSLISEDMQDSVRKWLEDGLLVGDFLKAALQNKFVQAYNFAPDAQKEHIQNWCWWLWNVAPARCWGSEENVTEWARKHRERRNLNDESSGV